ncbi:MAG: gamma-glutamyltransferase [Pyrinomonadaceae bacterium]
MNIQEAITAPRLHHQWMPDVVFYEPSGIASGTLAALKARGHQFAGTRTPLLFVFGTPLKELAVPVYFIGSAQGVLIDPQTGLRSGGTDPRTPDGRAIGY